jgi:hypothetical protein
MLVVPQPEKIRALPKIKPVNLFLKLKVTLKILLYKSFISITTTSLKQTSSLRFHSIDKQKTSSRFLKRFA